MTICLTMNIVLYKGEFNLKNINLLKKKTNTVVNGTFSKFTYSNEYFIMSGLYLEFKIHNMKIKDDNKSININYQPYDTENIDYLQYISNVELRLLDYYNKIHNINKKSVNILSKKLYSGNLKVNIFDCKDIINVITIKISGIWETENEVGLAIKLMYNVNY